MLDIQDFHHLKVPDGVPQRKPIAWGWHGDKDEGPPPPDELAIVVYFDDRDGDGHRYLAGRLLAGGASPSAFGLCRAIRARFFLNAASSSSAPSVRAVAMNRSDWLSFSLAFFTGGRWVMLLRPGGIDIFYIDESHDDQAYVVTAICVPFLRNVEGQWTIVWPSVYQGARNWRRFGAQTLDVPVTKELHAVKLASGRGNFRIGKFPFDRPKACAVYRRFLEAVDFLPPVSIMSVAARRSSFLYGGSRLEAAMLALFQRMRKKCVAGNVNAMTFFDQGHPEYRTMYRRAQKYLPTGSRYGSWSSGSTTNLPMDMFMKDANEKNSKHCFFTQLADLVAYAAFLKIKGESGSLEDWQSRVSANNIYDSIPSSILNKAASYTTPRDAIVRL